VHVSDGLQQFDDHLESIDHQNQRSGARRVDGMKFPTGGTSFVIALARACFVICPASAKHFEAFAPAN